MTTTSSILDCLTLKIQFVNDTDPFSTSIAYLEPARAPTYSFNYHIPLSEQILAVHRLLKAPQKVDECALQIYRSHESGQGDFGTYLDSDLSLAEQPDEVAILKEGRRTSLVLRTNLSVRVHTIIEKMLNSTGRELRRALFSLKQIFQDDKDLVHEFVQNDGLSCLIKVGTEADQNYQNYILRALGQIMLYVDGMNGVIAHNDTIQWLYSLLASQFRLVLKTALKLLLVFVEYTESNSLLLLAAVYIVDKDRGCLPWSKLMYLLNDKDNTDIELFIYTMTLINKTLNGIPDQDTYYDVVDALEEQNMELVLKRMISLGNRDLSEQTRTYEGMLKQEDGEETPNSLNSLRRPIPRKRMSTTEDSRNHRRQVISEIISPNDLRRSSLHPNFKSPVKSSPPQSTLTAPSEPVDDLNHNNDMKSRRVEEMVQKSEAKDILQISREKVDEPVVELNNNTTAKFKISSPDKFRLAEKQQKVLSPDKNGSPSSPVITNSIRALYSDAKISPPKALDLNSHSNNEPSIVAAEILNGNSTTVSPRSTPSHGVHRHSVGAVHSLAEKFQSHTKATTDQNNHQPTTTPDDEENQSGSFAAALSLARKCRKKIEARDPLDSRKESEIQWEKAMVTLDRPLVINDLDFTELEDSDDCDPLKPQSNKAANGAPPPPPPFGGAPPLPPGGLVSHSPRPSSPRADSPNDAQQHQMSKDNMKTVKLFWKEAQTQAAPGVLDKKGGVFWQKVKPVQIDTEKLVHLFETKSNKEVTSKKKDEKRSEIRVLDTKRSIAINVGLTKLPNPRAINAAILKFDASILNKECIEKILSTMMPTEEEKERIMDAQNAHPDVPLGSAEQFLLLLSDIPALLPRLKLSLFMLDYTNLEREVAEPLMDLKLALEELEQSRTFQYVLATLLAVGNALNGVEHKGFQLDFLAKVPEVKDTVNKHSLVYHLCTMVMEKFTDSTDLYSELGAVVRCAKVDFDEIQSTLDKTEVDCKAAWDYLRDLLKHDPSNSFKTKISDMLMDSSQRIMTLKVIYRRVMNRFRKFLLYMGSPANSVRETKVNSICKTIAEFSLEYRTCRDKIVQQKKRIQDKRERNKTRGKLIIDTKQWASIPNGGTSVDDRAIGGGSPVEEKRHVELSKVLKTKNFDDGYNSFPGPRLRTRKSTDDLSSGSSYPSRHSGPPSVLNSNDIGDDEILDGLVKAVTAINTDNMRERRRARHFNRKSFRRTRTLKLDELDDAVKPESPK